MKYSTLLLLVFLNVVVVCGKQHLRSSRQRRRRLDGGDKAGAGGKNLGGGGDPSPAPSTEADRQDNSTEEVLLPTMAPTVAPRVCPTNVSPGFANNPGVVACITNADCANFSDVDGPPCCLHPTCTCGVGVPEDAAFGQMCVTVDPSPFSPTPAPTVVDPDRNEGPGTGVGVGGTPAPITPEPSTPFPTFMPSVSPRVCPSSVSDGFANNPGVVACITNADCADFSDVDGPPCCLYPTCTCGVGVPDDATFGQMCVTVDPSPFSPTPAPTPLPTVDPDRNEGPGTGVGIGGTPAPVTPATPAPVTPAPVTPAPVTPAPATPAPSVSPRVCPSSISDGFANNPGVVVCITNADCANFSDIDGPPCCLYPTCTCGVGVPEDATVGQKCVTVDPSPFD